MRVLCGGRHGMLLESRQRRHIPREGEAFSLLSLHQKLTNINLIIR